MDTRDDAPLLTAPLPTNPVFQSERKVPVRALSLLLVIPIALFFSAVLMNDARGPHSLGLNLDPDYPYLFNALNILQFEAPGHVDHPGTTVQLLGAVVVFFKWLFGCLMGSVVPLELEVLSHPEEFLHAIQITVSLLIAAMVFLAGRTMYRFSGNLLAAIVLEATAFLFRQIPVALPGVRPEPLLVAVGFAMAAFLIPVLFAAADESKPDRAYWAGATFGFGMVTKITFFPWIAMLALFRYRNAKVRFLAAAILAIVILALPIASRLPHVMDFYWAILTHTGQYGGGAPGVTTVSDLSSHWGGLSDMEPTFFWWLFFYYAVVVVLHFGVRAPKDPFARRIKLLMVAGCLCMTVQLAMALKHFAGHYLLPCLMCTALLNGFLVVLLSSPALLPWARRSLGICGSLLLIYSVGRTTAFMKDWTVLQRERAADLRELSMKRAALGNCAEIGYYRSSLPTLALYFGNGFSANAHGKALEEIYPNAMIYSPGAKHFVSFTGQVKDLDVWRMVSNGKCVLVQGNDRGALPPEFSFERVAIAGNGKYTSEAETVLRLSSMPAPGLENPTLIFPTPDAPIVSSPVTLRWQPVEGAEDYWVDIGTAPTKGDLVAGSSGGAPFFTANLRPNLNGQAVYVQLYSKFPGINLRPGTGSQYRLQTAAIPKPGNPRLIDPAPGTILKNSPITFAWEPVDGAEDYWIDVGTAPAIGNILSGFTKRLTTATVNLTPYLHGQKIYVQLFTKSPTSKTSAGTGSLYQFATVPAGQ